MSGFFTAIKNAFAASTDSQTRQDVHPQAVDVPVQSTDTERMSSKDAGSPRSSANKSTGRLAGKRAEDGEQFYVHEGPAVSTVAELADVLAQADRGVFEHHISAGHNDFADWIRGVFGDDTAAAVVESARNPSEVVYILDTLSQ